MDKFKGAKSIVQVYTKNIRSLAVVAFIAAVLSACGGGASNTGTGTAGVDPNETAAKVNGKAVTMEEVDRAVKQQAQGQESKLSPLELAGARLQVLQGLIEQEVMFQKAEKENLVPSEEDVTAELNRSKVESRLSVEEFDKRMSQAGLNEKAYREAIKRKLAVDKLIEKITGRIETPKDSEIESFYNSNPEMFVRKRGVRLAAIVVDPTDAGQGDTTRNAAEADQKLKEIMTKVSQPASDFAAIAREYSEDPTKLQGGDMGYLSEDDLKQNYPQLAAGFMNADFSVGRITNPINLNGKAYIFKLQERIEKDENLTLESPEVRPQINQLLVENRKQLLAASYQAIAMNEAKIENYLAQKVVANPNELSGARPAGSASASPSPAANANANSTPPANIAPANTTSNSANAARPAANAAATPAANRPTAAPANRPAPAANRPAAPANGPANR